MNSQCVQRVRTKKDLEELKQRSGHTILLLHSENCGHCKDDIVDLEEECRQFVRNSPNGESPIAFARCDIADKECEDLWAEAKPRDLDPEDYGYPVKVGLNSETPIHNPIWFVLGRDPDKMNIVFSKIRQSVQQIPQNAPSPQQRLPQQSTGNPYQNFASQYATDHSPQRKIQQVRSGLPEIGTLCVSCDKETRENRMKQFILGL